MTKVEQNTFDMVHGTQQIYRKLLDCMARPGKVQNICDATNMIECDGISPALVGIALTLTNQEVTFHVISNEGKEARQFLHRKTFSKHEGIAKAQYIFIQDQLDEGQICEVMYEVNPGTLTDPHNSTTMIFHVKHLSAHGDTGLRLKLSGPGIKERKTCYIDGLLAAWLRERQIVNREFPLGVDMIFVSESGDIVALPRTTSVESEGV
jgi:alpha-D-ribose 1-methylphosphonate 5-triphosphate synthase subunit PhnH